MGLLYFVIIISLWYVCGCVRIGACLRRGASYKYIRALETAEPVSQGTVTMQEKSAKYNCIAPSYYLKKSSVVQKTIKIADFIHKKVICCCIVTERLQYVVEFIK